jgi:hypothetical protein
MKIRCAKETLREPMVAANRWFLAQMSTSELQAESRAASRFDRLIRYPSGHEPAKVFLCEKENK